MFVNKKNCRSSLLRMLETILFSPLLLCRTTAERQLLGVTYTNNYKEMPSRQTETIVIEIKSKFLRVRGFGGFINR